MATNTAPGDGGCAQQQPRAELGRSAVEDRRDQAADGHPYLEGCPVEAREPVLGRGTRVQIQQCEAGQGVLHGGDRAEHELHPSPVQHRASAVIWQVREPEHGDCRGHGDCRRSEHDAQRAASVGGEQVGDLPRRSRNRSATAGHRRRLPRQQPPGRTGARRGSSWRSRRRWWPRTPGPALRLRASIPRRCERTRGAWVVCGMAGTVTVRCWPARNTSARLGRRRLHSRRRGREPPLGRACSALVGLLGAR